MGLLNQANLSLAFKMYTNKHRNTTIAEHTEPRAACKQCMDHITPQLENDYKGEQGGERMGSLTNHLSGRIEQCCSTLHLLYSSSRDTLFFCPPSTGLAVWGFPLWILWALNIRPVVGVGLRPPIATPMCGYGFQTAPHCRTGSTV